MENGKTFKTKTGFCHVLPDKIILTREGIVGNVAKKSLGNHISWILIAYGIAAFGFLYFAFRSYQNEEIVRTIIFGAISLYLILAIKDSIKNSATLIIDRDKIGEVEFRKSVPGVMRSHFVVLFENEYGKIKKRLILLPGSLNNGQEETEKALKIMTEEKLIK
ncbi:MAG: hypothetical protein LUH22_10730 [Bacteroides sp.]|nr:hypothetical protein [Bacteroides sp.]